MELSAVQHRGDGYLCRPMASPRSRRRPLEAAAHRPGWGLGGGGGAGSRLSHQNPPERIRWKYSVGLQEKGLVENRILYLFYSYIYTFIYIYNDLLLHI